MRHCKPSVIRVARSELVSIFLRQSGVNCLILSAWVNDKINSKFIFPAICQERSRIPQAIWRAAEENDNLVEQVHGDVNHEGTQRTLVGGVITGQAYDSMRMKSLEVCNSLLLLSSSDRCSRP